MNAYTICGVNQLSEREKRQIYLRVAPPELLERFGLDPQEIVQVEHPLLQLNAPPGSVSAEMRLFHQLRFPDPVLYGQITDTINGQVHVLLYILNDPHSPRFNVDRMPDGRPTRFGTCCRNLAAEQAALEVGLAPGQIRSGLGLLGAAIAAFESFVTSLGQQMYFIEPLYYHNAIIFERYGFAYQQGQRLMEQVAEGFRPNGPLHQALDGSTPFRRPEAAGSIRLRSWALHDGLLGRPYTGVTMYKRVGQTARIDTCPGCDW